MGEIIRLAPRKAAPRVTMREVVVFLSCEGGEVDLRIPTIEDTPENREQVGMMLIRAAEALGQKGPY